MVIFAMRILQFIYRSIGKIKRLILQPINYIRTFCKFYIFCSEFHSFTTSGVPFVDISWEKGGNIIIGSNLAMNNGMSNNQIGFGETPCTLYASGANLIIGNNVGMSQSTLCAIKADIRIGDNTILGGGTRIYSSDFHPVNYRYRKSLSENYEKMKSKDVLIGSDCFIGAGSVVLKGVTIGDRSVIGAGSVVTCNIPSDCIAAGNPCKVIRILR